MCPPTANHYLEPHGNVKIRTIELQIFEGSSLGTVPENYLGKQSTYATSLYVTINEPNELGMF